MSNSSRATENGGGDISLSVEEANKLRAKLGLRPLDVSSQQEESSEYSHRSDVHVPAPKPFAKKRSEELKEKLDTIKGKRGLKKKLAKVKTLGESDSDVDEPSAWVMKSRRLQEEKEEAEKKAKMLDEMDEEFGIGPLLEEQSKSSVNGSSHISLPAGIEVLHDANRFSQGQSMILTLEDRGVLEEGNDALVNVNLMDVEKAEENVENRKRKPDYRAWENEATFDDLGNLQEKSVLSKYDEEIKGRKRRKFELGPEGSYDASHDRLMADVQRDIQAAGVSLEMPRPRVACEYFDSSEVKFKKVQKRTRKIRKKEVLKADDLAPLPDDQHLGSRPSGASSKLELKVESSTSSDPPLPHSPIPQPPPEEPSVKMEIDEAPDSPLPGDAPDVKLQIDDDNADSRARIERTKRLLMQKNVKKKELSSVSDLVSRKAPVIDVPQEEEQQDGEFVMNSLSEFCRQLGELPTYGHAGNRQQHEEDEISEFERVLVQQRIQKEEEIVASSTWSEVHVDAQKESNKEPVRSVLDDEPLLNAGLAVALNLAQKKGYLEKEEVDDSGTVTKTHMLAQRFTVEDKRFDDIDAKYSKRGGGRERYEGPSSDFKEMANYKPDIKIEYVDDIGRVLSPKEAFKQLSYRFHGRGPGKMKTEKHMKKVQEEMLLKSMGSSDTPLETVSLLHRKQQETQLPYVILTGSSKNALGGSSVAKN